MSETSDGEKNTSEAPKPKPRPAERKSATNVMMEARRRASVSSAASADSGSGSDQKSYRSGSDGSKDLEDEADDDEQDYGYDDDESSWEGEESEEEFDEDDELEEGSAAAESVFSMSTISNETDGSSDFEKPDVDRLAAVVVPEPQWAGAKLKVKKLAISCLLPLLLAFLCVYAVSKCIKVVVQALYDCSIILRRIILYAVLLALSPMLICYHLAAPESVQIAVSDEYEARVGRRLRLLSAIEQSLLHFVFDIPNIGTACGVAFFETFVYPMYEHSGDILWFLIGQYIYKYAMEPFYEQTLNKKLGEKKKMAQKVGDASKRMTKAEKKRIREQREKARRIRKTRKQGEMAVTLAMPVEDGTKAKEKVIIKEKSQAESISRTMIVERRYAVAVAVFWFLIGACMLLTLIDGQEGESCDICNYNEQLNFVVCRHGVGRDCAFYLHGLEIAVSVAVMSVGTLLLVYSTFLYKPRSLGDLAAEMEERAKREKEESQIGQMEKEEDPEQKALQILIDRINRPTLAKRILFSYRHSALGKCASCLGRLADIPLAMLLAFEDRKRLQERSIALQESIIRLFLRFQKCARRLVLGKQAASTPRMNKSKTFKRMTTCQKFQWCLTKAPPYRLAKGATKKFVRSRFALVCLVAAMKCLDGVERRCPFLKRLRMRLQEVLEPFMGGPAQSARGPGANVLSGRRQAAGGIATLEETLMKFGFNVEAEEEVVKTDKKGDGQGMGLEETQRDVGDEWVADEEDNHEDELELQVAPEDDVDDEMYTEQPDQRDDVEYEYEEIEEEVLEDDQEVLGSENDEDE